ncbi:MAG: hypothetical protein HYR94_10095 [Chloroflexi bacterium]|nr:hypothetical protein [Chloroflexota bacterium]
MIILFLGALFSSGIIFVLLMGHLVRLRLIKPYHPTSQFSVTVIVPCKGDNDPSFGENLLSIICQEYAGPVQFVFCVESSADSALPVLCQLKQQFDQLQICVAGLARQSSQKNLNRLVWGGHCHRHEQRPPGGAMGGQPGSSPNCGRPTTSAGAPGHRNCG